jgi:hypothetical protein
MDTLRKQPDGGAGGLFVITHEVIATYDVVKAYVPMKKFRMGKWSQTMDLVDEEDPVLIERGHHQRHQMPVVFKKAGENETLIFVRRYYYGLTGGNFGKALIFYVRVIKETFSDESIAVRLELFKKGLPQKLQPQFELKIREGGEEGIVVPQFPQARIVFIPRAAQQAAPKTDAVEKTPEEPAAAPLNMEIEEGKIKIVRRRLE